MKKLFIVFACILITVAFLSSASAIDRDPKSNGSDTKEEPTKIKEIKEKKTTEKKDGTATSSKEGIEKSEDKDAVVPKESLEKIKEGLDTKKSREKYDYFIDRNNNGIDDRLEKEVKTESIKKQKSLEKQETIKKRLPVPAEKKPAQASSGTNAPKKVKETKVSEQRKETKSKETEKKSGRDKR
jgi:hypothetical protein